MLKGKFFFKTHFIYFFVAVLGLCGGESFFLVVREGPLFWVGKRPSHCSGFSLQSIVSMVGLSSRGLGA